MQLQALDDKILAFVERKFRVSRSYATKATYVVQVRKFLDFVSTTYNLDVFQLLAKIKETKQLDPLDVLDKYYTFLSNYKRRNSKHYQSSTILQYVTTAKEFLNGEGCKIYHEDVKQRFKLPKITKVYEKGLTKETLNRLLRFANPKLATAILVVCSSGLRIGEVVQLRLSDIDLSTKPTTIIVRAETTKTRETRLTHLTSEATKALKDYLSKNKQDDYLFLIQKETNENEEQYAHSVRVSIQNLQKQLLRLLRSVPDLNSKNSNGRNTIHFHAFRAWFKTQVTDAHQSDFAEALMGHSSLKLVYYRQNDKARARTYLDVEHALTIADTEKIDQNFTDMQKDNFELRGIVDSLSKQLRNLEKRIETRNSL